jgi:hypothetical protein
LNSRSCPLTNRNSSINNLQKTRCSIEKFHGLEAGSSGFHYLYIETLTEIFTGHIGCDDFTTRGDVRLSAMLFRQSRYAGD